MPAQTAPLVWGFLIHLQLGVPYSYSVLRPSIESEFNLSPVLASLPFSAILVAYTLGMVAGGRWSDSLDTRLVCCLGTILFAVGFLASGWSATWWHFALTYGLLCGFGIGLAYVSCVSSAVAWNPMRRGLATGVVVLGFGVSAAVFAPIISAMVPSMGWRGAMSALGVFFACVSVPMSLMVAKPPGWRSSRSAGSAADSGGLWTPVFWWLWLGWVLVLAVGIGWIGLMRELASIRGVADALAATSVAILAVSNGLGRPVSGFFGDRWGRSRVLVVASLAAAFGCLTLGLAPDTKSVFGFSVILGLAFGTWLVNMAPTASERFGSSSMGSAYGALFTSYGVGALGGPILLARLKQLDGSLDLAMVVSAGLLMTGAACFVLADRRMHRHLGRAAG